MNEKEFEDIICKYPELIENGLLFIGRQVTVKGKRIDVLFKDAHGNDLILELKKGTVIRDHCSQLMEYEGYFISTDNPTVRVMLVGNRVPENLRRSMDYRGFEWKEITIDTIHAFLSKKGDSDLLRCLMSEKAIRLVPAVSVLRKKVVSTNNEKIYIEFWNRLNELVLKRGSNLQFRVNNSQYQWYRDIDIGYSNAGICLTVHKNPPEVTCELQIPKSPELYDWLYTRKDELINRLSCHPQWIAKPGKLMRRIRTSREVNIFELEDTGWGSHLDWLLQTAERFQQVFIDFFEQRK